MVKEHPQLYQTVMVRAILDRRKTKTRRTRGLELVNNMPDEWKLEEVGMFDYPGNNLAKPKIKPWTAFGATFQWKPHGSRNFLKCPYGKPGDIVWVRESFAVQEYFNGLTLNGCTIYKASYDGPVAWNWKPSIHMPKTAARIWLEITNIKVERLQTISEKDSMAEGIESKIEKKKSGLCTFYKDYFNQNDWYWSAKASFMSLWQSTNGRNSWISNPWVWVITFKVLSTSGKSNL